MALVVTCAAPPSAAAERFLISSTPFGGAAQSDSPAASAPAGVGVYFGFSITDNGTCLGCDMDLGLGTLSDFTVSLTAQNSPNFSEFLNQATAGSSEPGHLVWAVLWTTNTSAANVPIGAPLFVNSSGVYDSLPSAPPITEIELVIDHYCVGSCTLEGDPTVYDNILIGTLNIYAANPVPLLPGWALLLLGASIVGVARILLATRTRLV